MHLLLILLFLLPPGEYLCDHTAVYVGIEHELPSASENETYPSACKGEAHIVASMHEQRRIVTTLQGPLGVSLYFAGETPRPTVILVHGNDAETREMGYIIPFFVTNGVNVISYDQRGTGDSPGNWFLSGPQDRARDIYAVIDAYEHDPHIDRARLGIWGFSNGGWTAPLVAVHRPLAFVIVKSGPAETVRANTAFEVVQEMRRHHESADHIAQAQTMVTTLFAALDGRVSWTEAATVYERAKAQPWFAHSLMIDMPMPPPQSLQDGLRRTLGYDPTDTLTHLRTPTLLLYGGADIRVDVPDTRARMTAYLKRAGNHDVTMHLYPGAGHTLKGTRAPDDMLAWLRAQRILR